MKCSVVHLDWRSEGVQRGTIDASGASWVQLGDQLLVYADDGAWEAAAAGAHTAGLRSSTPAGERFDGTLHLIVQKGRLFQQHYPQIPILVDRGRYLVAALAPDEATRLSQQEDHCFAVRPLTAREIVFRERRGRIGGSTPLPWVQQLVNRLSRATYETSLRQLVGYPTRLSTSTHFADAAAWACSELTQLGYTTSSQGVTLSGGTTQNIIAEKLGRASGSHDLVLVTAHLDSINIPDGPSGLAPGADDNASGSAGLLEIARVLAEHLALHDLRLVLFGGEEQGLHGSQHYVATLSPSDRARLWAVINMDMIGTRNTPAATVLLEGAAVSQSLIDLLADAAATYTGLTVQTSLSPYASDHVPFINAGLPALLTIEGADSANTAIHSAADTIDRIDYDLAIEILRMNVAAIAITIGQGGRMPDIIIDPDPIVAPITDLLPILRTKYSGRYTYNGGASARAEQQRIEEQIGHSLAVLNEPIYNLEQPIFNPGPIVIPLLRFTVHIDIDGTNPLNVVSGTVAPGLLLLGRPPAHFIGQVTSNTVGGGSRNLIVENFSFVWPGTSTTVDRLEISLTGNIFFAPTANATFIATGPNKRFGPFLATQESRYFHDVEVEVDVEDGAVPCEPYNTHTHPDRPADLPQENLTLEKVFARAGIGITRSAANNTINTAAAGANSRWNYQELHDAMESHWSAFANNPQWKMWIFLAELADSDGLGGVMFDGDINEPGGVDRQGTAIFTLCPHFHTAGGAYPVANPPAAQAAQRELFFNLIHETGHAFNLAHSFQKQSGLPWTPPAWMPLLSNPQSLSWMNYPEEASPGAGNNATWFYNQFRFRFDDGENLFLRHAPDSLVQMGNANWFEQHGRVARYTLDRRLELRLSTQEPTFELGEPVFVELRLKNISDQPVLVHRNLDPSDEFVELAVTNPRGERRPFISIAHTRAFVEPQVLAPNDALYQKINLTVGQFGFPFKEPGVYRIEASFTNLDGTTAAAILQVAVRPPASYADLPVIGELFNARVGRVLYVGGTRLMEDVNEKIDWVRQRLGEIHPTTYYLSAVRALPYAQPFKLIEAETDTMRLLEPDPEFVERTLKPVVEQPIDAANALGHITYRQVVDTYTDCAIESNKPAAARDAQRQMLEIFEQRAVVPHVVEQVRERVDQLR